MIHPQPPASQAEAMSRGWACQCPACGQNPLFKGLVNIHETCPTCQTNLRAYDAGDGPAAFLIFGIGAVIMIGALILEIRIEPPIWVHMVIWLPAIIILTVVGLRFAKSIMMALQLFNKSGDQ